MSEWVQMLLVLIPLFALPWILGTLALKNRVPCATRWWFGVLATSLYLLVTHALHLPQIFVFGLLGMLILWGIIGMTKEQVKDLTTKPPFSFPHPASIVIVFLLTCLYLFILSHPIHPMSWDALVIWFNKAKGLFYWLPFYALPYPRFEMANYPHLGAVYEMFLMKFTGAPLENFGRLIFPTFYFMWILALNQIGPVQKHQILRWVGLFMGLVFFDKWLFTNGYQDGFLAVTGGMALLHLTKYLLSNPESAPTSGEPDLFLGFFFAGSSCLIKMEGSVMNLTLTATFLITLLVSKTHWFLAVGIRKIGPSLTISLTLLILWPILLTVNHMNAGHIPGNAYAFRDILTCYRNLDRWQYIAPFFANYGREHSLILSLSAILSILSSLFIPRSRIAFLFLWLAIFGYSGFVALAFLATKLPLLWHLETAFSRLMFQQFAAYAFILFLGMSFLWDKVFDISKAKISKDAPTEGLLGTK
ncbi:MAG: hypothetical protein NC930_00110 [Candidatus Omnitrophica bacterium]|nr:hypothetical protein [Candidatus Omnitrophota bacterium]